MRRKLASLLVIAFALAPLAVTVPSFAGDVHLAQDADEPVQGDEGVVGEEDEAENPGTSGDEGTDPAAETGAGEEEQGSAEPEAGPLWTYQMSRIGVVLLILMLLGIGGAYWNFVGKRAKEGL